MRRSVKQVPFHLDSQVESEISRCRKVLVEYGYDLPDIQTFYYKNSRVAGESQGINRIHINSDLLNSHTEEMVKDTVPHELAHCLVHQYSPGAKPHGPEWQRFMRLLGCEPVRCHEMEQPHLPRKRQKRHAYECACRIHMLTTAKHHNIILKGHGRHCTRCKTILTYKDPQ
jgi:SprT protein